MDGREFYFSITFAYSVVERDRSSGS